MRLGQLARKLNINTDKIIEYLTDELGAENPEDRNTKLDDKHVEQIIAHFEIPEPEKEEEETTEEETPANEESVTDEPEEEE